MKTKKLLLSWGIIWLFLGMVHALTMGPRIEKLTEHETATHTHALGIALIVVVMGLLQPYVSLKAWKKRASWSLVIGSFLFPIGIWLIGAIGAVGEVIDIIGSVLIAISILIFMIGILKNKNWEK